jgi:hypothetical protein
MPISRAERPAAAGWSGVARVASAAGAAFLLACAPLDGPRQAPGAPGARGCDSPPAPVVALAAGGSAACALLADGTVWCWGDGATARADADAAPDVAHLCHFPHGDTAACVRTPERVAGITGAVEIAVSRGRFACARTAAGLVRCWGFGDPAAEPGHRRGLSAPLGLERARGLALGHEHACALLEGGGVACWGDGYGGELCGAASTTTPRRVPGFDGATALALGDTTSCARFADGAVRCCGGRFGAGALAEVAGLAGAAALAVSGDRPCALVGGELRCLPRGEGATGSVLPFAGLPPLARVAFGGPMACARAHDGRVFTFHTALEEASWPPTRVFDGALDAACGDFTVCARLADGRVSCSGSDELGQRGEGGDRIRADAPGTTSWCGPPRDGPR